MLSPDPHSRPESIQQHQSSAHASQAELLGSDAEVWHLKTISYGVGDTKQEVKIITQNYNGPCSFIAICNILILRGDIKILPPDRPSVSYEFLAQLVGEYLLLRVPDVDISAALSMMPLTQKGMDLNPLFTGATSFRPSGDGADGALKLFEQAGITLVHGWLVDPESSEATAISSKAQDYDTAVTYIADADHTAKGQLVLSEFDLPAVASGSGSGGSSAGPSTSNGVFSAKWTSEEREKIENAIVIREFLDSTQSQLTYHGLFHLATTLEPGSLVALFRNSHLSVLHKPASSDAALYSLVTDYVFLHERSVVWERFEDVDGHNATFVDSNFVRATPVGGDYAGQTAEDALRMAEIEAGMFVAHDPGDLLLAQQLQSEEDNRAQMLREDYRHRRLEREFAEAEAARKKQEKKERKANNKKNCIIM
ncbi:MINDY-DUB domain-containing protein [Mycena indigotica]|uniref:MINDY-DUB domain-containing protein n=1 Tax=Mycena indigotica TaxID=2126181 RepID=A0A8H6WGW9_9AGAR|nr:MINDY-DUB domain-containing protein [Mycena indigotica]KAF7311904.1 MINDY-DUB domain-containing protein [Mycena indigotica]